MGKRTKTVHRSSLTHMQCLCCYGILRHFNHDGNLKTPTCIQGSLFLPLFAPGLRGRVFAVGTALESKRTPEKQNRKLKKERACSSTCGYAKMVAYFLSIISDSRFQPTLTIFSGRVLARSSSPKNSSTRCINSCTRGTRTFGWRRRRRSSRPYGC